MTKRAIIESLRQKLRERNADSTLTNQFLYTSLLEQAQWIIKRETSSGRIYRNNSFFQTLSCQDVIETSTIEECCPVKTNCKIYRTKNKLPEAWLDAYGPLLKTITSVDGTTDFFYTSATTWQSKRKDPYQKMSSQKYFFFANNYIWFPEHNPHKVNITGFFLNDISLLTKEACDDCPDKEEPCVRWLDTEFYLPEWCVAEALSKAIQLLAGVTEKIPSDNEINKNDQRRG